LFFTSNCIFRETFTGTVSREKRRSKEIRKEGRKGQMLTRKKILDKGKKKKMVKRKRKS
jgi:hypothetical protein